jgi:hypothetical protein
MHDRLPLTSDGFAAIFRAAEAWKISVSVVSLVQAQGLSNAADEKPACCAGFE